MEIKINYKKCNVCGNCTKACTLKAITIINNRIVIDNTKCDLCKSCYDVCSKGVSAVIIVEDIVDINDLIKNKINTHIHNNNTIQEFADKIDKKKYVKDLKANGWGFDVGQFVYKKKFSIEDIKKFNTEIILTASKYGIPLYEVLCSISNDLINIKIIFNMLTSENKAIVKNELADKYKINEKSDTITNELLED